MKATVLKQKLQSVLRENLQERYETNKKRGKLDYKKLYKIERTSKLFKQKNLLKGKDYSFTLLLDNSGSMFGKDGKPWLKTQELVYNFLSIFNQLGIDTSFWTFNNNVRLKKGFNEKISNKEYKEIIDRCSPKLGTADAKSLHRVGNTIFKERQKNILLVITDGEGESMRRSLAGYLSNGSECYYGNNFDENFIQLYDANNNQYLVKNFETEFGLKYTKENILNLSKLEGVKSVVKNLQSNYKDLILITLGIGGTNLQRYLINGYGKENIIISENIEGLNLGFYKLINKKIKRNEKE